MPMRRQTKKGRKIWEKKLTHPASAQHFTLASWSEDTVRISLSQCTSSAGGSNQPCMTGIEYCKRRKSEKKKKTVKNGI